MNTQDTARTVHRRSTRRRRAWRGTPLAAVLVAIAWGVAACGGGSPQAGSGSPGSSTSQSSNSSASHSSGSTTTTTSSGSTGGSATAVGVTSQALEFARCMRANGASDFPDPVAPGSVPPPAGGKTSYLGNGFNPNSPTVQAAEQACQRYATGLAKPVTPAVAARVQAQQLKYAQCMRSHGVPDFPDPSSTGGFAIPNSIDQNGPSYQAAVSACQSLQRSLPGMGGS